VNCTGRDTCEEAYMKVKANKEGRNVETWSRYIKVTPLDKRRFIKEYRLEV
jgi:hypothetical protein